MSIGTITTRISTPTTRLMRATVPTRSSRLLRDLSQRGGRCEAIERVGRQGEQPFDAPTQRRECGAIRGPPGVLVARYGGGIRHAPVRARRMPGPDRTGFACGVIADRDDEIHLRCPGDREFVPRLAAQAVGRIAERGGKFGRMRLHPLVVFLALIGGVTAFGVVGLLIGPLAAALFLAGVRIYDRDYRARLDPDGA